MDRRDFLKLAAAAGLTLASPMSSGLAQDGSSDVDQPYEGTFYVMVNAGGGWDPTSLCDPKGNKGDSDLDPMNRTFTASAIEEAGPFRYAPVGYNATFFPKYADRLLVINGVDCETNGHDSGSRNTWAGTLNDGAPSFAAIVAANNAPLAPMAYVSNGGYDFTAGIVSRTRSGSTNALVSIAYPNRIDPNNEDRYYHTEATVDRMKALQAARLDAMVGQQNLPRLQHSMNRLYTARAGTNIIKRLTDYLPEQLDNSNIQLRRQAQVAIAAYKAGIAVSANLNIGGFDTHGNHDQSHIPRLDALLQGVDFLMEEAERQGVADKVFVMVGSDFGRTPGYNDGNGKDHWPITSVLFMGAGVRGGRLIGATTERHGALNVMPDSLDPVPTNTSGSVRITPSHIHRELRRLAGIDESFDREFPLKVPTPLNLFG